MNKISKMKTISLFFFIPTIFVACSNNNDLSDAYGNFEADDVMVSAETTGKLLLLVAEEGSHLRAGDLAAIVDTTELVLKRNQLIAQQKVASSKTDNIHSQIEVQKQQLANLTIDKNRLEKLLKDGAATQKQQDDITGQIELVNRQISNINTQYITVRSEFEVFNAQIDQVNESIRKSRIYNPLDGVVLETFAETNEVVMFGKPLFKIADLSEMNLRIYVSGDQLSSIKRGQEVQVLIDKDKNSNAILSGKVGWISESAEFTPKIIQTKEERVNMVYAIKIRVKNDGSLKIGMPGEVRF
jgi:HlyD family secretion protein